MPANHRLLLYQTAAEEQERLKALNALTNPGFVGVLELPPGVRVVEVGSGLGLLESCTLFFPEAVVLDADIYQRVRLEAGGLDTSPAELALDVVREVGPRGHFLAHPHTRKHVRQRLFSDLTAVVDLEEQLRLKDSLARLGELTAGLAHEFRNGLATVHGYARLIDPGQVPAPYASYVQGIRDETDALGHSIFLYGCQVKYVASP